MIQRVTAMTYVRFKVTVCLYLSPNNRARSLSTLMAAIVNKDIKDNPYPEMKAASHANRQSLHCSRTMTSKEWQREAGLPDQPTDQLLPDNDTRVWMADEWKISCEVQRRSVNSQEMLSGKRKC